MRIQDPVLFIINKNAGNGFHPKVEGKIVSLAARHNVECTFEFTRSRGHATTLAKQGIEKGFKKIAAIGGDGTLNEVAQSLVHSHVQMGMIPKGSGNGLCRHLGIPLNFEKAIETVFTGKSINIDTFLLNDHVSINISGVGFDGHVANLFGKDGKRGLFGYLKLSLSEFLRFHEFDIDLVIDGRPLNTKAFIVAIANSSQYGNNARIAPWASVTDHLLHLTILKKVPIQNSISFFVHFSTNQIYKSRYCRNVTAKSIQLKTRHPVAFHVDGEPCGFDDNFTISIKPKSLKVIIPNTNKVI
jgi:diacylglycerol kinase (ATP)